MITFPDLYITHIGPRSLKGIKLIDGIWCDIQTSKPVSARKVEQIAMSSILQGYLDTDWVAFAQKIEQYRRQAN